MSDPTENEEPLRASPRARRALGRGRRARCRRPRRGGRRVAPTPVAAATLVDASRPHSRIAQSITRVTVWSKCRASVRLGVRIRPRSSPQRPVMRGPRNTLLPSRGATRSRPPSQRSATTRSPRPGQPGRSTRGVTEADGQAVDLVDRLHARTSVCVPVSSGGDLPLIATC